VKDLKEKTIRGGAARLVGYTARSLVRLGALVILARLLDPSDFGLVAMVTVVTGVLEVFATGGLSAATVQRAEVSDAQISTLFWFNVAIGALLGLLCLAAAPVLSKFYEDPRTALILVAVAPAFVFNATGVQHLALLQRHLRYVALAAIEVGSEIFSAAITIGMAVAGYGYWAIVAGVVTGPLVITIGAWAASGWIPGRPRGVSEVSTMLRFGGTITLNNLVVYAAYNLEKVLLGRYFGPDALGLYGRAYELINLPTRTINSAIGGVAFASLARLQGEPARFKSYFLKGYSLVVSITLPATIACAVFADDIILVTLGPKWTEASTIFRLLAPTILVFGMINPLGWLLPSVGLQERSLKIAFVLAPLIICSYLVGLPYGPNGVALAFSTAMVLWLVPHIRWSLHGTPISVRELLSATGRALLSGGVAAVAAASVQHFATPVSSAIVRLALGGTVMLAVYVFTLLFVMKQSIFYFSLLRALKGAS
jgi:O-antigen/teichoic acid export membrane protein